jgi:hypothetical protein
VWRRGVQVLMRTYKATTGHDADDAAYLATRGV